MMIIREVLARVRNLVETSWLHRGAAHDDEGREVKIEEATRLCLAMAILRVSEDMKQSRAVYALLGFKSAAEIGFWNDKPGRTRDDVLALIDQALSNQ